jgi:hypothetical protein
MAGIELTYAYRASSLVRPARNGSELLLATSGGLTEAGPVAHPYLFRGFLTDPGPAAQGMLACAAVARARYYTAASTVAALRDPVVTSNGDRLRFESFSGCCGVHARLDLLPSGLDGPPVASGTTNVDFNEPMRAALAGAAATGVLLLSVGADEVRVTTAQASVAERKVPLPDRWLKGFGEVQALARPMRPVAELARADAQQFIRAIPRRAKHPLWAIPAGRSLTLTTSPRPGAACLAGAHRLAELGPLLRFARGLRVYSAQADARSLPMPSAWELDLGTARFTLTLSPEHYRGFTGEGALLGLLADRSVSADADMVSVMLAWDPLIDIGRLAADADFSAERTVAALTHLAATGRVGYDLAEESFFHRELPFGSALEAMHPRLADARALVSSGSVVVGERGALVRSGDTKHQVTFGSPYDICTCPWWGKHRGTRGPCKHVLAARMAANS